jgi:hypothetical protein
MQLRSDHASSVTQATILLVAITFALAVMVLLISIPFPHNLPEDQVPAIFVITEIRHVNEDKQMVEDGWVVLKNTGPADYNNLNLYVITYVNGKKIPAEIPCLNANRIKQITNHHGIEYLEGYGASGTRENHNAIWVSTATLSINYNNHSIRPGDIVTIEIYNTTSNKIISRDTYPHTEESKQERMMREYLSRQGA